MQRVAGSSRVWAEREASFSTLPTSRQAANSALCLAVSPLLSAGQCGLPKVMKSSRVREISKDIGKAGQGASRGPGGPPYFGYFGRDRASQKSPRRAGIIVPAAGGSTCRVRNGRAMCCDE
jgi:hypothetical protein